MWTKPEKAFGSRVFPIFIGNGSCFLESQSLSVKSPERGGGRATSNEVIEFEVKMSWKSELFAFSRGGNSPGAIPRSTTLSGKMGTSPEERLENCTPSPSGTPRTKHCLLVYFLQINQMEKIFSGKKCAIIEEETANFPSQSRPIREQLPTDRSGPFIHQYLSVPVSPSNLLFLLLMEISKSFCFEG